MGTTDMIGKVLEVGLGVLKLIPTFSEEKKEKLEEEVEKLLKMETAFLDARVSFGLESIADELLGMAGKLKEQQELTKNLYIIYAKEVQS